VYPANGQFSGQFPRNIDGPYKSGRKRQPGHAKVFAPIIAASHQENCATIPNYLESYLRYMDAGE
jgi:hypothetical protein